MNKPFVSVIVPAYNEEDTISACLKSLCKQKYPENKYEIIVIDNNSTDNTVRISRSFNVTIIRERNQGLVFARRKGIAVSRGDIIAFIDADSVAKPLWLAKMVQVYIDDSSVVGVGQNLDLVPKTLFVTLVELVSNLGRSVFKILPGAHFSFRKNAYFKNDGYSLRVDFNEDIYFSKKLKKIGQLVIQPKGLVVTSSRRLLSLKNGLPYLIKTLLSFLTITFFDISFFKLKPIIKPNKNLG